MISITIHKTGAGIYRGFSCIGHAGYCRRGRDIICAAVSILTINTVNSLEELAGAELLVETEEDTGKLECYFKECPDEKSVLLMDALVLGLEQIVSEYGKKYITLQIKEV